ncbi:MAG TPA: hypothetical protein VKX24_05695, partial [Acidimicrobiia bacterium]|nr:hypothetical protein [Acidimicrobiia bacterium]
VTVGETPVLESRRRYRLGAAVGIVSGAVCFTWMLTGGTWDLLQRNVNANFYDVQARALFHGHWDMPASTLTIEGIREGSRTYMYYGPVPAILRMPVLLLTHRFDGRLTVCSMLLAFLVAMVFVARLGWRIRSLVTSAPVSRKEAVLTAAVLLTAGVGSAFFFLGSDAFVYHEAELWGAALALGAFDFLLKWIVSPTVGALVGTGVFATLDILTRGSVGAGPVVALVLVDLAYGLVAVFGRRGRGDGSAAGGAGPRVLATLGLREIARPGRWAVMVLAMAAVPVLLYVALNEIKFGTLFTLPLNKQVLNPLDPNQRLALADNGGSLFGLKFVPTALLQFVRPDALRFSKLFPFVAFPPKAQVIGGVQYDILDFCSSLTSAMPALVALGVIGAVGAFGTRRDHRLAAVQLPIVGAVTGTFGVLAIAYIANRYLADFLPVVFLCALSGLYLLRARSAGWRPRWRRLVAVGLGVLALFGVWVNVGLGLLYQRQLRGSVPVSMRAGFVAFQERLNHDLFDASWPGLTRVGSLGRPGPPGSLAIVGRCTALYQSNGSVWAAVERSTAGGHYRLSVVFPARAGGAPWPILVNGTRGHADYLAVQPVGAGRIRFQYLFQGYHQRWALGSVVSVVPGRRYVIDAVLDPRVPQVTAHLDGATVLLGYLIRATATVHVGVDPFGGPTLAHFPGALRRLPVTTPICDALEAGLRRAGGS